MRFETNGTPNARLLRSYGQNVKENLHDGECYKENHVVQKDNGRKIRVISNNIVHSGKL